MLQWYTLSGSVSENSKEANLIIYRNKAGRFDSAPQTEGLAVGSATLVMRDCQNLQLRYQFFERNESQFVLGPSGTLALTRLVGFFDACSEPDGRIVAPTDLQPDNAGLSAKQSGAWFVPSTSGQGMMLTVQPPTAAPGYFFGSWFTYDRTPNDPNAHHWLSLGGETRQNANGEIEFKIFQTTGGELSRRSTQNTTEIGRGTLRFLTCDRAVLDYQFHPRADAGGFRGLSGRQQLQKIVACAGS